MRPASLFTVVYHPKVRKDLGKIHQRHVSVIREAIDTKLALRPEIYGKPLRHTLKNLRSMRIGNYRIVYAIKNAELIILVLVIGNRDSVYREAEKRWKDE